MDVGEKEAGDVVAAVFLLFFGLGDVEEVEVLGVAGSRGWENDRIKFHIY